jgi:hypothetical protein
VHEGSITTAVGRNEAEAFFVIPVSNASNVSHAVFRGQRLTWVA